MLQTTNDHGITRKFEEVQEIPNNYIVWNIGRHNFQFEKYIPLCETIKGTYSIKPETLKCYKCPSEEKALEILKQAQRKTMNKKRILEILAK